MTKALAYRFDTYTVFPDSPQMQKDFLCVITSLMAGAADPMAAEIVHVARANNILPVAVEGFQEYPGRGLGGLITLPNEQHPRAVLMGVCDFLKQCGLEIPALLDSTVQKWTKEPGSRVLVVGWDRSVRGVLKFSPPL